MPVHKSAKKRVKQNFKKNLRNVVTLSKYKSAIKEYKESIESEDSNNTFKSFNTLSSLAAKAVKRGVIKKKTASRNVSKLYKMFKPKKRQDS